jgi:hypothetical protein
MLQEKIIGPGPQVDLAANINSSIGALGESEEDTQSG